MTTKKTIFRGSKHKEAIRSTVCRNTECCFQHKTLWSRKLPGRFTELHPVSLFHYHIRYVCNGQSSGHSVHWNQWGVIFTLQNKKIPHNLFTKTHHEWKLCPDIIFYDNQVLYNCLINITCNFTFAVFFLNILFCHTNSSVSFVDTVLYI